MDGNGLKNELDFFDDPLYHAPKPRAWYIQAVKKRIDSAWEKERTIQMKFFKTPRGKFKIKEMFKNRREAEVKGYGYYFTFDGYDIMTKTNVNTWHTRVALCKAER